MTLYREMIQINLEDQLKAVVDTKYGKTISVINGMSLYFFNIGYCSILSLLTYIKI